MSLADLWLHIKKNGKTETRQRFADLIAQEDHNTLTRIHVHKRLMHTYLGLGKCCPFIIPSFRLRLFVMYVKCGET